MKATELSLKQLELKELREIKTKIEKFKILGGDLDDILGIVSKLREQTQS